MKFFLGLLFGFVIAIGIAFAAIKVAFGSIDAVFDDSFDERDGGSAIARNYDDLVGFDRIEVAGVYDLDVEVGPDFSVKLSGSEEEMQRVSARVEDGVLILERDDEHKLKLRRKMGVDANVTLPALSGLSVSGVVDGEISGVNSEAFEIDISGVADVNVSGECGTLTAQVSGVGDLSAQGLKCRAVDVDVSGVGDADVYASEEVDATISGIGDIDIYGSPKSVKKDSGMFASITVK
jgi:hypothetical protein